LFNIYFILVRVLLSIFMSFKYGFLSISIKVILKC
jgi:hypothetical protein